jgi:hypothetical protein
VCYFGKILFTDSFDILFFLIFPQKLLLLIFSYLFNLFKNSSIANRQTAVTDTKDRQQSMGNANNNQSVSSDMDTEMRTSLSSGKDVNVLSNDDALHIEDNACNEDARTTRELGEDTFPYYYDDTIMSDSEFDIQLVGDECLSLGKEHQVKLLNEIKQLLQVQLYKATALSIKHIV